MERRKEGGKVSKFIYMIFTKNEVSPRLKTEERMRKGGRNI